MKRQDDRFSGQATGNPNALSLALVKIAYGIVAIEDTEATQTLLRSTRHLGVIDVKSPEVETADMVSRRVKMALEVLAKTIGRIEAVWKPVTPNESFEIVRRRLFTSEMDYAAGDAVVSSMGCCRSWSSGLVARPVYRLYRRRTRVDDARDADCDRLGLGWGCVTCAQCRRAPASDATCSRAEKNQTPFSNVAPMSVAERGM